MRANSGQPPLVGSNVDVRATDSYDRGEPWPERIDRNLVELLQELRVAQAGIQILFAFLLTLAFTQRFEQLSEPQRLWYIATLMFCAASTALLIAPASFHRLLFRRGMRTELVQASNLLAIAGLAFLLVATVSALGFVIDFVEGLVPAVLLSVGTLVWFATFWYVLPLVFLGRGHRPALLAGSDPMASEEHSALDGQPLAEPPR